MLTARSQLGGSGIQSAALSAGGLLGGGTGTGITETFNGTVWSAASTLISSRQKMAMVGVQNSTLIAGGTQVFPELSSVESWNGSVWSSTTNMLVAQSCCAGAGVRGAVLVFGAETSGSSYQGMATYYNGTAWMMMPSLLTARRSLAGSGSASAAMGMGGDNNDTLISTGICEVFSGLYLTGYDLCLMTNLDFSVPESSTPGTTFTPTTIAGGYYSLELSKLYSYTNPVGNEVADLNTLNKLPSHYAANTGECLAKAYKWFTLPAVLNTPRAGGASVGMPSSMMHWAGYQQGGNPSNINESYNGTSWLVINPSLNQVMNLTGIGVLNAALSLCGRTSTTNYTNAATKFNGVSWSSLGSENGSARAGVCGFGSFNNAMTAGGAYYNTSNSTWTYYNTVNRFNGLTWSSGTAMTNTRSYAIGVGTPSAAIASNGISNVGYLSTAESWNGTAWSTASAVPSPIAWAGSCGRYNAATMWCGLMNNNPWSNTFVFNGSSWSGASAFSIACNDFSLNGSRTSPLAAGFYNNSNSSVSGNSFVFKYGMSSSTIVPYGNVISFTPSTLTATSSVYLS
jgi:hypothetical protein